MNLTVILPSLAQMRIAANVRRPTIDPVVPLSANGGGEGGDLLGAASHPPEREADPLATRVLNRGDAIVAQPGRADDFSCRVPIPTPGAADVGPASDAEDGIKNDANKSETKRSSGAKNQPAQSVVPPPPPCHDRQAAPQRSIIHLV